MGAPVPFYRTLVWFLTLVELQPLPSLYPQEPEKKNPHSQIRPEWRGWYSTKGPHLFAPVTLPPTPAEPYEPEFGWWAVSTDSAASSAALSGRGDTVNASPFLHKCDGSAQRHKSDEKNTNRGWIITSIKVMKSYIFIAELVLKMYFLVPVAVK